LAGLKDVRRWAPLEAAAPHVTDDPHHGQPVVVLPARVLSLEALADGILSRPVSSGHALVNDGDQRRRRPLFGCEVAAAQKGAAQGLKVVSATRGPAQRTPAIYWFRKPAFHRPEAKVVPPLPFKQSVHLARRFDAGKAGDPFQNLLIEGGPRLGRSR